MEVKKRDIIIASLKTDIEGLRREIQERDDTIQDKVGGGHWNPLYIQCILDWKTAQLSILEVVQLAFEDAQP